MINMLNIIIHGNAIAMPHILIEYSANLDAHVDMAALCDHLRKAGIERLFVCGIVTNGGVASTVRDAHVRDFHTTVLSDGCAAFSRETHEHALSDLSSLCRVATCAEALQEIAGDPTGKH